MASSIALSDAQANLSAILDRAENGEEILIAREGRAAMRIVPVQGSNPSVPAKRVFGQNLLGITYIAPDFEAPMTDEELKEWGC